MRLHRLVLLHSMPLGQFCHNPRSNRAQLGLYSNASLPGQPATSSNNRLSSVPQHREAEPEAVQPCTRAEFSPETALRVERNAQVPSGLPKSAGRPSFVEERRGTAPDRIPRSVQSPGPFGHQVGGTSVEAALDYGHVQSAY